MTMMMMITVVGITIYLLVDVEASIGPARGKKVIYIYTKTFFLVSFLLKSFQSHYKDKL